MAKTTCLALMALLVGCASPAVCAEAEFDVIDAHVRTAPSAACTSIASLAGYLTAPARGEREKARGLFTWIALNVNYDVSSFGEMPDPAAVLKTRRAVCAGYAALFKALADAAGLEAVVVHGHAKGVGPEAATGPDGLLTHDWNAVRIGGQWALMDCTWGAGRVDEQGRFRRRFCEHYFATPPELFIYDHLPLDERWQLLGTAVSRAEFVGRVWVQPAFFEHGLRLISHEGRAIESDGSLAVRIRAPRDTLIVASLSQRGWDLDETHTFSQRVVDEFVIRAAFPAPGDYVLRVFSRERDAPTQEYESALEYAVRARRSTDTVFPKMYASFQQRECHLASPLSGVLRDGQSVDVQLQAPGAEDVIVGVNGLARHLVHGGDGIFSGTVAVERGQAAVFARFPGSKRYEGLLRYEVR